MPPLRDVLNNTPVDATDVEFNFNQLEQHIGSELINRDGSVAMTGPLTLPGPPTAPQHASTKQYSDQNVIPVGSITMFAGAAAPDKWVICDGSQKSTTDPAYAALFAVIGYSYGGSGGNFNVPDLRGRFPVGVQSGQAIWDALNDKGGQRDAIVPVHDHAFVHDHTADIPTNSGTHNHVITGSINSTNSNHRHGIPAGRYVLSQAAGGGPAGGVQLAGNQSPASSQDPFDDGTHTHGHNIAVTNGQGGHDHTVTVANNPNSDRTTAGTAQTAVTDKNLPPFIAINFIIRIG